MHARFSPVRHRFLYRIFLFALDLDELDDLQHRLAIGEFPAHARMLAAKGENTLKRVGFH